jgi:hypothetical protein
MSTGGKTVARRNPGGKDQYSYVMRRKGEREKKTCEEKEESVCEGKENCRCEENERTQSVSMYRSSTHCNNIDRSSMAHQICLDFLFVILSNNYWKLSTKCFTCIFLA